MSKIFTFSNVNSIKDIDPICSKRNFQVFEKYIQNKMKKSTNLDQSKSSYLDSRLDSSKLHKDYLQRKSQPSLKRFDLRSHRLTQSEKSLTSILINRQREANSIKGSNSRPSSIHKKVSFQNLVLVIDTDVGIKKREKLIEKESKLRNGYFFNSNQIRLQ
ncbi:unnamed protein product (macronuclear) [Paramecium tetraurelia]|uniref:Uncharacterized protein n=1 Tax=Paramecium tetraurelia TaxID=5888 RepID=A0DM74_PARTE|nr:uncharacterized protein GSPATT00018359001 [Paramecium tetraurelia]CAK84141.1 unnamed protein product [Paramecium tetraurelia]|eukprot:XP_001451538.1 hypothetical protein (macronuclear) [Paramecium tetraurelia strain d4-2]